MTMSGEEIAQKYGWTRMYVSNTLKSAMRKIYQKARKEFPDESPFEICEAIRESFELVSYEDINVFFELFPKDIRQEIRMSLISSE